MVTDPTLHSQPKFSTSSWDRYNDGGYAPILPWSQNTSARDLVRHQQVPHPQSQSIGAPEPEGSQGPKIRAPEPECSQAHQSTCRAPKESSPHCCGKLGIPTSLLCCHLRRGLSRRSCRWLKLRWRRHCPTPFRLTASKRLGRRAAGRLHPRTPCRKWRWAGNWCSRQWLL